MPKASLAVLCLLLVAGMTLTVAGQSGATEPPPDFRPGTYTIMPDEVPITGESSSRPEGETDAFPGQDNITYDNGTVSGGWYSTSSDQGWYMRFTPQAYPCELVGAYGAARKRGTTYQVYLRVYNNTRATLLYNQLRTDMPTSYIWTQYWLTSPLVFTSDDFYLGWHQLIGSQAAWTVDNANNYSRNWRRSSGLWSTNNSYGDCCWRATVNYHDVGATGITTPASGGSYMQGANITPQGLITNLASNLAEGTAFSVDFKIRNSGGTQVWTNTKTTTLTAGQTNKALPFDPVTLSWAPGTYTAVCSTRLALDCRLTNNKYSHTFTIFSLPPAPTPQLPANGSNVAAFRPTLQVAAVSGATQYNFRLFLQGGANVYNVNVGTNSWAPPADLINGQSYEWDCRAQNAAGWGPYFGPRWTFRVMVLPGAFTLVSPADNAKGVLLTASLDWNASSDAISYDVYLEDASPPGWKANVAGVTYTPGDLVENTDYYWTVVAKNAAGNTPTSSGEWTFRTELTSKPELVSPANGDTTKQPNAQRPTFEWTDLGPLVVYDIEIDNDDDFLTPEYGATGVATNTWTPGTDIAEGHWYWRVRGDNGAPGDWCESFFDVFVDITPPSVPVLGYPVGNEVISTGMPNLDWDAIPDARQFNLELYDELDGLLLSKNIPQAESEDKSEYQLDPLEELADMANYTWKVEALDYAENSSGFCTEEGFRVEKVRHDVAATAIITPSGEVFLDTEVYPKVRVYNDGEAAEDFDVRVVIDVGTDAFFEETEHVAALGVGETRDVEFATFWTATPLGTYAVKCTTELDGDVDNSDNKQEGSFTVTERPPWPEGWTEVRPVPDAPTAKAVKDGGWLATGPDQTDDGEVIYAVKGYKTTDFFKYYPLDDSWQALEPVPSDESGKTKPPYKGCRGISDNQGAIYMTKGNNTLGFWRYDIQEDTWTALPAVPQGPYRKRVKGGTDLVYRADENDSGWVYLLKGYKTEFYRYNVQAERWDTLEEVPYGYNKKKYDKGSFLTYNTDDELIYAHQAKYYDRAVTDPNHFMFRYDLAGDTWYKAALKGMPLYAIENGKRKRKKSKDGGSGAWHSGHVYALKGGNTQGFFKYFTESDTWAQLETVPGNGSYGRKKRVKNGGDLAAYAGAFFALKGNKTFEFWRYMEPIACGLPAVARSGVMSGRTAGGPWRMAISPNPIASGFATLRYSLPRAGPVSINVHDVAGRSVLRSAYSAGRRASSVSLDLRRLAAGVYLVRLDADGCSTTQKLVVQR